jgi:hypothetical protein
MKDKRSRLEGEEIDHVLTDEYVEHDYKRPRESIGGI